MYEELKYWYLRNHTLFQELTLQEIKELCVISGFKQGRKGEILYFTSADTPRVFILKKGAIKIVSVKKDGEEVIRDIIRQGDLFGELSLEHDKSVNEFAKVLTDEVSICSFLLSDFETLLLRNPGLALTYTKFVGLKMKRIKNYYSDMVSKDARTRLIKFISHWAEWDGERIGKKVTVVNYLTHNDIAQIICTSRQTATILLNELQQCGLIEYNRRKIVITDLSALGTAEIQKS